MPVHAVDRVLEWLKQLIPPAEADAEQLAAWRKSVFVLLFLGALCMGVFAVHIIFAKGVIGDGYAQTADVARLFKERDASVEQLIEGQARVIEQILAQQSSANRRQLVADILDRRERQCRALKEGNSEAAAMHGIVVNERLIEFEQLTGIRYRLQSCREIGVEFDNV